MLRYSGIHFKGGDGHRPYKALVKQMRLLGDQIIVRRVGLCVKIRRNVNPHW